jgi:uncharacterized Zn-finger protein
MGERNFHKLPKFSKFLELTGLIKCKHCGTNFTRNKNLLAHSRIYHKNSQPQYKCDVPECEKSFKRNEDLTRHKRVGDLDLQISKQLLISFRSIQGRSHTDAKFAVHTLHKDLLLLGKCYITMTTRLLLTSM